MRLLLEGLTLPEIEARYADILHRLYANDPDFVIPGGESHRQHFLRNMSFVEETVAEKAGKTVVLVGHGRSNVKAIKNGIAAARRAAEGNLVDAITQRLSGTGV